MSGDINNLYDWQTNHIGIKNGIKVRLLNVLDLFDINVLSALNLSHILNWISKN